MPEHHGHHASAEASRLRAQLDAIKDRGKQAVIHVGASVIGFVTSIGLGVWQGYNGGKMPALGPVPADIILGLGGNAAAFAVGFVKPLRGSEPLFGAFGNAGFNSFGKDVGLVLGADMKKKAGATKGLGQGAPQQQQQHPRANARVTGYGYSAI